MALPIDKLQQIKQDASKESEGIGDDNRKNAYYHGYRDGSIAEAVKAQKLVEALEIAKREIVALYKKQGYKESFVTRTIDEALAEWKGSGKGVELTCMVCGEKFMGPEPKMCCSGRDCGCMGLPVEPIVCSKECYEKGIPPQKGDSGGTVEAIDRPCPHCGKELSRDRNLCCRECGKEVER